jgi:hypothetical protein
MKSLTVSLAAVLLFACTATTAQATQPTKVAPSWTEIQKAVNAVFASRDGYKDGDIICRSEAIEVMAKLAKLGWKPANAQKLISKVPEDHEFIVVQLRKKDGWDFMRHVAKYPLGYDRLDRMVRLPRGETFTLPLITQPGGYRMIEYMTTASGGVEMGKMLNDAPNGENFNKPTGRIYTASDFLGQLYESYETPKPKSKKVQLRRGAS